MYVSAKWKWVWNVCIVWEVRSLLKGLTGLQNQRDVIYVNDPTRECPGASLWCVNGFPALLFLCRVAATPLGVGVCEGQRRLVNRGGWWLWQLSTLTMTAPRAGRPPACPPVVTRVWGGPAPPHHTTQSGLLLLSRGFKPRRLKQCGVWREEMQVREWWWAFCGPVTRGWG